MKFLASLLLVCVCNNLEANDSILIKKYLQNILNKQHIETNFFVEGSFTSVRQYNNSEHLQQDNNIFFTALIAFTLQELKPYLKLDEIAVVDTIINRTQHAFNFYKNKNRVSYNFWRTDIDDNFFPNDDLLPLFKNQLKLPDDLDDTSIILATLQGNDSTSKVAHKLMQQFVNTKPKFIKNTFKKYKNIAAYNTWYGIKMPIDFDFGVHCNILSFVNKKKLEYTGADSATISLIINMIDENYHITHAKYISPYYANSSVLLYHITRLMTSKKIDALEKRKSIIISQIKQELKKEKNILHQILLLNSLYKLGIYDVVIDFDIINEQSIYNTDFVYYTGHIFGHMNNTIKKITSNLNATQFKWYCSAFNDCIILENLILKHRSNKK